MFLLFGLVATGLYVCADIAVKKTGLALRESVYLVKNETLNEFYRLISSDKYKACYVADYDLNDWKFCKGTGEITVSNLQDHSLLKNIRKLSGQDKEPGKEVVSTNFVSPVEALKGKYVSMSYDSFINHFYTIDASTNANKSVIEANRLFDTDCRANGHKKVLIYHTHGSESYADSDGTAQTSVIGVGDYLEKLLVAKGYEVIHIKEYFDRVNGQVKREGAYDRALIRLEQILRENPDIDVIIDLHRDGGERRTVNIGGENVAKLMLFNGISYDGNSDIADLPNPNREGNLAFSLQLKTVGDDMYEGLFSRIYVRNYRYNMHLRKNTILLETGTDKNTFGEAKKAMDYFAEVFDTVLK